MTEREGLSNKINEILLANGCLNDEVSSMIYLVLDEYEITKRTTEIVVPDGTANANIINEFAISKAISGHSPKTVKQYTLALRRFDRMMQMKLVDVKAADIRKYMALRIARDGVNGPGLVNERMYLSAFFSWAVNNEYMLRNPIKQTESIRMQKKQKKAFSPLECEMIRGACTTLREKALVEMLFSTACRVSELVEIKTEEIDGKRVMVHGKGNKYAAVYLDSKARYILETYINNRTDNNPYLFIGRKAGTHLSARSVETIVRKIGERAGVENVHPHRFRRTTATHARNRGMGLEMVSKMLRHESIETTMRYLDISEADLSRDHEKYVG